MIIFTFPKDNCKRTNPRVKIICVFIILFYAKLPIYRLLIKLRFKILYYSKIRYLKDFPILENIPLKKYIECLNSKTQLNHFWKENEVGLQIICLKGTYYRIFKIF